MVFSKQLSDLAESTFPALETSERVVLLIDVSRSMTQTDYPPRRLDAAKQAALAFIDKKLGIDDSDEVAVVAFAGGARTVHPLERVGGNRERMQRKIAGLGVAYSGTKISRGLERAETLLHVRRADRLDPKKGGGKKGGDKKGDGSFVPRIVVLSDGENLGGDDPVRTADRLKKAGVFIDAIGIGERGKGSRPGFGLDEQVLQAIASPGHYQYIRDSATLLFHFEGLAEKLVSDAADGFKAKPVAARELAAPSLYAAEEVEAPTELSRRAAALARSAALAWVAGLVPAAIIGGTLTPALVPLWAPILWLLSGLAGLAVTWSVRFALRWSQGPLASVAAVVSAAVAVGLEASIAGQSGVAGDPLRNGLALALALAGVSVGLLWRPRDVRAAGQRAVRAGRRALGGRRGIMRLGHDSPHVGELCPNEKSEDTRLREGDLVVVCPHCARPHHADCWIWNGGQCFGGDTPCPGRRAVGRML